MDWIDITYGSEFCYIPREISTMLPVALSEDPRTYVCEQGHYYYESEAYLCAVGLCNHSSESVSLSIYDDLQAHREILIFTATRNRRKSGKRVKKNPETFGN